MILRGFGGVELRPGTPAYDAAWAAAHVGRAPGEWQERLRRQHALRVQASEFEGNTWLREVAGPFGATLLPLHASDDDVRAAADRLADECRRTVAGLAKDEADAYAIASRFCSARGIAPAPAKVTPLGTEARPALARMACAQWWRRRLRAHHGRTIEGHAWRLGIVHGRPETQHTPGGERYVSDANAQRRAQQRERNAKALAATEITNQHGQSFSLADLAERTTANPAIRRGELMTRIAGFEAVARELGHAAEFWTATAPSRFHSQGGRNPKFEAGTTARDAQQWLCRAWARFRAWAGRQGVRFYGVRVAEPHQDGCPHWHLLLFMPGEFVKGARDRFFQYWTRPEKGEAVTASEQADREQHAVKFEAIKMDEVRSAAGYVSKYIAKNIDGYSVQTDLYGHDAVTGSQRIEAWAATWGIRQFQQVGGAPVGVWRELRRLHDDGECTPTITAARAAADVSGAKASDGWADYTRIQGGPTVKRADLRVTVARTEAGQAWDAVQRLQVPAPATRYGEVAEGRTWGVRDCARGVVVATRLFAWEVRRRSSTGTGTAAQRVSARAAQPSAQPRTRVNNCTRGVREVSGPAIKPEADPGLQLLQGAELAAWMKRRDVRPEFREWWTGGGGAASVALA